MKKSLRITMTVVAAFLAAISGAPLEGRAQTTQAVAGGVGEAKELVLDLGDKVTLKLVYIPAGKFVMGSPNGEKDRRPNEGPQHAVTISKPFYLGVTEVTQAQYEKVMGENPSMSKAPDNPVEQVSWDDAVKFCRKVSETTKKTVRLPAEAEWEYACRAGTATAYSFTGGLTSYAWFLDNSEKKPHPVGLKTPNRFGLYDMHGNVWEWCNDWYSANYDVSGKNTDPQGPDTGTSRVLRGGCWYGTALTCRSASRFGNAPVTRRVDSGFRVVAEWTNP